jgi:hypothetical protein
MVKETFNNNDSVFEEYELGSKIYFITTGEIVLLHKKTKTKIQSLKENEVFGSVAFFSG